MELEIIKHDNRLFAWVNEEKVVIKNVDDAVDLLGNCSYQGAGHVIIDKKNLSEDFFDLKTGIAGEILQKFSNYRMKLSIIGDFKVYKSNSLQDFIFECNKIGLITFVSNLEEALQVK